MRTTKEAATAHETASIVVYIDTIDDIYSDFDIRKIDIRILSVDFINELRLQGRHSADSPKLDIQILAPRSIRKREITAQVEKTTRRRIRDYFEEEFLKLRSDRRKNIARAIVFLVSGLTCFFITKLAANGDERHIVFKMFIELITFFSWFATWNGIDAFGSLPRRDEIRLNRKLAVANVHLKFIK